jgi:predicted nucleic acid-binding protein
MVVDASAVLEMLLRTPLGLEIERQALGSRQTLHAPHLLDVEVVQVIRRFVRSREMPTDRGQAALEDFMDFPIVRHPHELLLMAVWSLRSNFSAYDAVYVALAELLDVPLLTHDRRLASAASRHVRVELV